MEDNHQKDLEQIQQIQTLMLKLMNIQIKNLNLIQKLIQIKNSNQDRTIINHLRRQQRITYLMDLYSRLYECASRYRLPDPQKLQEYSQKFNKIQRDFKDLRDSYNYHIHINDQVITPYDKRI